MKNQKEQISSSMLLFSIACYIQSTALFIGFISSVTKQDTWIAIIIGLIIVLPIILIFTSLSGKFPGKSLIEINDIVYGKILGKIFSILYIFFFFTLAFLNTTISADFVTGTLIPETPKLAILILFISTCCYAVRKGPETMTRYSTLFSIIIILVVIINSLLLIKNMKFSNFEPSFSLPFMKYIQGAQTAAFLPFAETIVFFMLFPNLKNPTEIKKPLFGGLIIGAITILAVSLRDTAVLGPLVSYLINPAFEAVRLINLADILTRMEILYAIILLMLLFFKVSILIYAIVKGLEQIFNISSYKILVPIVGIIVVYFALIVFDSSMEHSFWGANIASIYSMLFNFILPLITLIVASIRGFRKNKKGTAL